MSAERDELLRLVQELPEDKVQSALTALRRHSQPVREGAWPPAFFASAPGDGTSIGEESEEQVQRGFGR